MLKWIGMGIIVVDIFTMILLYFYLRRKSVYKYDFVGLLFDSWEVISLLFAVLLLGLVLFLT